MEGNKTGYLQKLWNILLPLVVYYAVYMISVLLLSCFGRIIAEMPGTQAGKLWAEQKMTLTGIINGIGMLAGAAVLLPMLRAELREHHNRSRSSRRQDISRRYESIPAQRKPSLGERGRAGGGNAECKGNRERKGQAVQTAGAVCLTVVLAASSSVGLNILLALTGFAQSSASYQDVAQSQYGVAFGVGVVLYAVVSPVAEEIVFRGVIYNRMYRYYHDWLNIQAGRQDAVKPMYKPVRQSAGKTGRFDAAAVAAVVVSGVLFGVYHGNPVQGVYGGCMGILMACLYERTHAFYIPCLFHAAANCTVYLVAQNAALHERIFTLPCCVVLLAISAAMILIVEKGYESWVKE